MKTKPKKKTFSAKLDRVFSKYIRTKKPCCEICYKPTTEIHHIIGRRVYLCRWEEDNVLALCPGCHFDIHQKLSPNEIDDITKHLKGDKFDEVKKLRWCINEYTAQDYQDMIEEYERLTKSLLM